MPVTASAADPDPIENLTSTLRNIGHGMLGATKARLANSPETREFLEIGLALLRTDLIEHTGPDIEQGTHSRLFESLSRERIIALAEARESRDRLSMGVNTFRHRWPRKDFYTEDLIAYLFRTGPQQRHVDEMAEAGRALMKTASLGEIVRVLASSEVESITNDPLSSIQGILQAALPSHPQVREFSRSQYDTLLPRWALLYEEITKGYGLTLAPAYTWNDVALLFNSVVEGAIVRARVEGEEPTLSSGEGLLAGAIFAILPTILTNCPGDFDACFSLSSRSEADGECC